MPEMLTPTSAIIGAGLGSDVALMTDGLDVDPAVAFPGRWFLRPHGLGNVVVRVADRLVRRGHLAAATSYAELGADFFIIIGIRFFFTLFFSDLIKPLLIAIPVIADK